MVSSNSSLKKKWWFRTIRSYSWFSFRYWWFNYFLWFLLIFLLIFWIYRLGRTTYGCGDTNAVVNRKLRDVYRALDNCCPCLDQTSENADSTITELNELRDSLGGCTGEITATLRWNTTDDLDLIVIEPNGNTVYFRNKSSNCGGVLDIDRNFQIPFTENAIENICYTSVGCPGQYKVGVHFYDRHSSSAQVPYFLYLNVRGKVHSFKQVHPGLNKTEIVYEFDTNQ